MKGRMDSVGDMHMWALGYVKVGAELLLALKVACCMGGRCHPMASGEADVPLLWFHCCCRLGFLTRFTGAFDYGWYDCLGL